MAQRLQKSFLIVNQPYQIFNQDCHIGLKNLQDSSIDCIITDPPYFIDGMGNEWNDEILQTKAKKSGGMFAIIPVLLNRLSYWKFLLPYHG